jgi:choline transport protein
LLALPRFPTAGGQYYWVSILAPRSYRRFLSYITGEPFPSLLRHLISSLTQIGYLCAITWQTSVAGTAFIAGTLLQSVFVLNIKTYDPHAWHGTLLTIAFLAIAVTFNTLFVRKLPLVEAALGILHVLGIFILVPLWIKAPKRDGGSPIIEFYNQNGWASNGLATLIGTVAPAASLTGLDCSVHMGMFIP